MPSLKQLAANRANARKSTGPRTPEGKARSSQNALKSGLYAQGLIIGYELASDLEALIAQFTDEYHPTTPTERSLVDQLIHYEWLLRRYRWLDTEVWKAAEKRCSVEMRQVSPHGYSFTDTPAISRVHRERRGIQRMYRETLAELRLVRAASAPRPDPEPAPQSSPQPTDLETTYPQNGFVSANSDEGPASPEPPQPDSAPTHPRL